MNAQEQENKLVDRLLRPDMTLQNNAQNKKFVAASVAQDRQVKTKKFAWQEKTNVKSLFETRKFPSRQFHSRSFHGTKDSANLNTKTIHKSDLAYGTQTATGVRIAADSDKKVTGRDFADNHPFRGQGKSQKALQPAGQAVDHRAGARIT